MINGNGSDKAIAMDFDRFFALLKVVRIVFRVKPDLFSLKSCRVRPNHKNCNHKRDKMDDPLFSELNYSTTELLKQVW